MIFTLGTLTGNVGVDFPSGHAITFRRDSPSLVDCGIEEVDRNRKVAWKDGDLKGVEADPGWTIVYAVARYGKNRPDDAIRIVTEEF